MAVSREQLIKVLNEDLAKELGTIIRYNDQAARIKGLKGHEVRELLVLEIQDEVGHARYLADKIVMLGGEPTIEPYKFPRKETLREMLELNIEVELADSKAYYDHARMAEEFGDYDLMVQLENMASDERRHADQLSRLLEGLE